MASQFFDPAARPEARLDQHGARDQGAPARRRGHRTAEALHRGSAGRRRGRGPRCDGAGTADLPASGVSRPLPDRTLALRWREGRAGGAAGRRRDPADQPGRPAAARRLRPAPHRHGTPVDPHAPSLAPARPCLAGRRRGRQDRGLRSGARRPGGDVARSCGRRSRGGRAGADRARSGRRAGPIHHRCAGGASGRPRLAPGAGRDLAAWLHAHDPGHRQGTGRSLARLCPRGPRNWDRMQA